MGLPVRSALLRTTPGAVKPAADGFQPEVLAHGMADIDALVGSEMEEQEFGDLAGGVHPV